MTPHHLLFFLSALGLWQVNAAEWHTITVPGAWEEKGPPAARGYDGVAWYRTWVKVPDTFSFTKTPST
jgi:hypothetical protein